MQRLRLCNCLKKTDCFMFVMSACALSPLLSDNYKRVAQWKGLMKHPAALDLLPIDTIVF